MDNEVYESCATNFINLTLHGNDELKTMDFEESYLNANLFYKIVKHEHHSTLLFSSVESDDEDMESNSIHECNFTKKTKHNKFINNFVVSVPSFQNLKPHCKTGSEITLVKEKKCYSIPVECSTIAIDFSFENSPLFILSVKQKSRIFNSADEDDDRSTENVSRKSVSVSEVTTLLSDSDTDSENRKYSAQQTDSCNTQDFNATISSTVKYNNYRSRFSHIVTINSDLDESDIEYYSYKKLIQLISPCSMQDDNASAANVIEVNCNKPRGMCSNMIILNSDSDEDNAQYVQTNYGPNGNVPGMFSKQVLESDLTTGVESLLDEDERLKLQIAEAVKIIMNSQVRAQV